MKLNELVALLKDNMYRLSNENVYKSILNMKNGLIRFDSINRIMISLQTEKAFDIKTADEWTLCGKNLVKGAKPIYILLPVYKNEYFDKLTEIPINKIDLNNEELQEAIRLGIVEQKNGIAEMKLGKMFDISDTLPMSASGIDKYNMVKPELSLFELFSMFRNITGYKIERAGTPEEERMDTEEMAIYLWGKEYTEIARTLAVALAKYAIFSEKQFESVDEWEVELIKDSISFSLQTLFALENVDTEFKALENLGGEQVLEILNIINTVVANFMQYMKFDGTEEKLSTVQDIDKIRRAEKLLNSLNAFKIRKNIV